MQISNPNNIKIYNLSAGKSLPEWLSDRRKRSLQKSDIDVQRRIELLQDFEMPTVSNCVQVSKDGQYIFATGVYKPRFKCYDVNQMSLKFERCFDATVVKFLSLSDDYSKLIFMMDDRTVEFHAQHGRYYRTRIPKFGRDLAYHEPSCDLYMVGASSQIYRLNLEQGRFLNSLQTSATGINCCQFNPVHHLFSCGSTEGHVESWDPRSRSQAGKLDCAINTYIEDLEVAGVPAVTSIRYKDALNMAVGTSTGQILLYDIRTDKPYSVKDHNYGLPIKKIEFHPEQDLVLTLDPKILKLWNRQTGKPFTSIEPGTDLNDLCLCPGTGMMFLATEAPKILTYYIPALGPAPRWCSFLDNLTEELEENPLPTVYDDYKFVTRRELEELGLAHLIGSSLLRAYMHGFFMDVRLYRKAKSIVEPFAYEEYRRSKIREKIEEARANRVQIKKKLPKVNRNLAEKLLEQSEEIDLNKKQKIKQKEAVSLLKDDRFSAMFANPDFQVDEASEEYRLLNPVVSKMDKQRQKKRERLQQQFEELEDDEIEGRPSSDESSSDDDHTWTEEVKKQHRLLTNEARSRERAEREQAKLRFYEVKESEKYGVTGLSGSEKKQKKKETKISLGERVEMNKDTDVITQSGSSLGSRQMTFSLKRDENKKRREQEAAAHHKERRKIRRSAADITKTIKTKPKFWMGKRVQ